MIKLQDFAREMGVTERAIQKHLKTYSEELEGLYQRKGPNGTWLTDEAVAILRSKMRQNPVVLGDKQAAMDLATMQKQVMELQGKLIAAHEIIADQRAKLDAGSDAVLRLQAAEHQAQSAQEALGAAQREAGALRERLEQQAQAAAEAARSAQAAVEAEHQAAEEARKEAEQSAHEAATAQAEAERLQNELESLKSASIWRRIFGWR